jgi:hypothetical protein
MSIRSCLTLLFACLLAAAPLTAAAAPPAPPVAPLLPGEGLALAGPDGTVYTFGEASREFPMGSLAKLVWIGLEGIQWASSNVGFNCTGQWRGHSCWLRKGHGKVDLAKALQDSCNLAFLAWIQTSAQVWTKDYGEGAARARLEDAFGPFLGNRLPPGDGLPSLGPEWVGDGELLRTSPEAMVRWLADPAQDQAVHVTRRLLSSFFQTLSPADSWWIKTGTAPVPGEPGATSAWAAGGNGQVLAVLHLPRGKGKQDGLERFRAVLQVPAK